MLSRHQVETIELLLGQPLSQREVARRTGAARGTVGTIAAGKHPWQTGVAQARVEGRGSRGEEEAPRPTGRCGGCGRMIELPCRACEAEAERRGFRVQGSGLTSHLNPEPLNPAGAAGHCGPRPIADVLRALADEVEPLGVDLKPEQDARYRRVRAAREAAAAVFRRKCREGRAEAAEIFETVCGRCQRPLEIEFARGDDGAELVTIVADGHAVIECPNCRRAFPPLRASEAKDLLSL